MFNMFLPALTL